MKSMLGVLKKLLSYGTILVLSAVVHHSAIAQVTLRSGFVQDSLIVGDEVAYYLSATYPRNLQLLFPDSTFSFQPFEFQRKQYFTTQTHDSLSYDSTVYFLSTFEVELVQHLQLPAFILHQKDCTTLLATRDSLALQQLVTQPLPDTVKAETLPLISNTAYEPVDWLLNYPLLLYISAGLLLLALLGWLLFGKRIRKHFAVKRLRKQHELFVKSFNEQVNHLKTQFSSQQAEHLLSIWKKYMEGLDTKPYTKLTTKETAALLQNQLLGDCLRIIDSAVYGHNRQVEEPLLRLREHAVQTFQQKLDQVAHG